ncbi:S-adenosyl-L-methionine-dependent methyltransferase [Amniculicola lignicola CBS 123094]|uniref:S-adenosyl-L-methionine-dependent methyltransferase n=1 Tax=Amniculicola lignicola CBS 123094 TaxID=1392246 RepID=A0A6A5VWE4_9PLEO|nr:S-adenosyl-L-methionine-dependent methyltransferase [Amniculicola lignicola CBS 123094]
MSPNDITGGNALLARVYAATTPDESRAAYDEWAKTYDADMVKEEYVAPTICAEAIADLIDLNTAMVLDAGCGSGRCGLELANLASEVHVDGIDYSEGMLKIAKGTGAYKDLGFADLTKSVPKEDGSYDAVICVGTLTQGHVGPDPALKEFVRVVKAGGLVVATVLEMIWEDGFKQEVERLEGEGHVKVLHRDVRSYRKNSGVGGRVLVLKKL